MNKITHFSRKRPLLFAILLTLAWLTLFILFMILTAQALGKPYGEASTLTWARLAAAACTLLLAWRLGWLKASGIARLGRWQVWLIALVGLVYFAWASLYALYGKPAFDFYDLLLLPEARPILLTQLAVSLSEEFLFRGLVLYTLVRAWGHTRRGKFGALLLSSLLFALLHLLQVFTSGLSIDAALVMVVETLMIAVWWGALVLWGGSLWPAILSHLLINALPAIQGLSMPLLEPTSLAYTRLLLFSFPLALLGLWLALRVHPDLGVLTNE